MGQGLVYHAAGQGIAAPLLRRLRAMHEDLARDFATALSALMRTPARVSLVALDQLAYGQFVSSLETPACFYVLKAEPWDDRFALAIEPSILHPMIDCLLGGGGQDQSPPDRPLTEIEWCLAARIVRLFLEECRHAWHDVVDLRLDVLQTESNPRPLRVLPADEPVMMIAFGLTLGELHGMMRLCLPCRVIERMGERPSSAASPPSSRPLPGSLAELTVTLAETQIAAGELSDLGLGDIIATETPVGSPATVSIDGVARFQAQPGVYQGRKAIRLTEPAENLSPPQP
jgi:flagellar motor switch protein FliM